MGMVPPPPKPPVQPPPGFIARENATVEIAKSLQRIEGLLDTLVAQQAARQHANFLTCVPEDHKPKPVPSPPPPPPNETTTKGPPPPGL